MDIPQNPVQGLTGNGISLTGSAGTAVKSSELLIISSIVTRKCLYQTYFKGNAAPYFYLKQRDAGSGVSCWAWFDCATGAITSGAGLAGVKIQACQDGWFRAQITFYITSPPFDVIYEVGFSDNNTAFDLTSDGSTIDGWVWGGYATTISGGNALTYPAQFFPYSGNSTTNSVGPLVTFNGADVTAAPHTLWAEMFSRDLVPNASALNQGLMSYDTDTSNYNQLYISNSGLVQEVVSSAAIAGAAQWAIVGSPSTTSGINNASSGGLIRSAVSCATNDIDLYASDGTLIGTDGVATVPTAQTSIRLGQTRLAAVSGRGYQITRAGIKSTTSSNSEGPV